MKFLQLIKAIDSANRHLLGRTAAAVDQALVIRNWLIGAYLVEFEQNGEDRARYGGQAFCSSPASAVLPWATSMTTWISSSTIATCVATSCWIQNQNLPTG